MYIWRTSGEDVGACPEQDNLRTVDRVGPVAELSAEPLGCLSLGRERDQLGEERLVSP